MVAVWAVMDIGTNSTRLLIAAYDRQTGQLQPLKRALKITRIGEGMSEKNRFIQPAAIERTMAALEGFAEIITAYPVKNLRLVATQAVREAVNQDELVERIKERLGWTLEVISGEREALLSYHGAVQGLKTAAMSSPLAVDIGGGSTEFMVQANGVCDQQGTNRARYGNVAKETGTGKHWGSGRLWTQSISIGALRLLEHPQSNTEIGCFLAEGLANFPPLDPLMPLVAVGGTATTIAAVKLGLVSYDARKVQGLLISSAEIREIDRQLRALKPEKRLEIPGMTPGREEIILPGLQILLAVMGYFGRKELTVSDQDLLQGLILAGEDPLEV